MNESSAQPCGCDAGAHWVCERHRITDLHRMICPHCGNDDPRMVDVTVTTFDPPEWQYHCRVCSRAFQVKT